MDTKEFDLSAVLSVTTERMIAKEGIGGIYEILNWMTGDSLFTHQLPRAIEACKPWLLKQFPELGEEGMNKNLSKLNELVIDMEEMCVEKDERKEIVAGWLLAVQSGEWTSRALPGTFAVKPLPPNVWKSLDPVEELGLMMQASREREEKIDDQ